MLPFDLMTVRAIALALILAIHPSLFAGQGAPAPEKISTVQIDIPGELVGPRHSFPNAQSELDVYVSATGLPPAMLQVSWVQIPYARTDLSEESRQVSASHFLDASLTRFSKNVSNWTRSAGEPVRLGGYKAVRANWSGTFHGQPTTGTMYFVVLGRNSYCFHAFGRADVPNAALSAAVKAIERAQVKE